MKKKVIAIVPAAGLGKRFNASVKKTFIDINGIPLFIHTLKRLCDEESVTEIIPVLKDEDIESGFEIVKKYNLDKIVRIAPGGKERQDSIYNALQLVENKNRPSAEDIILIHDGVRPFIPKGLIAKLIAELKNADGAIPGVTVKETLKSAAADGTVVSTMNRENLWAIQTPQAFFFNIIRKAYDTAYAEGFYATDDAALVERTGGKVKIITGSPFNIKVTTPEDRELVEWILGKN
jgi:2-C-methyl-D-erythritol 4-phosphate cytidylyltransferase